MPSPEVGYETPSERAGSGQVWRAGCPVRLLARWHEARRRFAHSLRWRMVGLFLLLAFAMTVVLLIGMQRMLQGGFARYAAPLVTHYLDLAAAELGTPPSTSKAAEMVARLPIRIRIEGPVVNWDSHPGRSSSRQRDDDGRWKDGWTTRQLSDGHRVTFGLVAPPQESNVRTVGWAMLAALLALVATAWLRVSRMLRPIELIGAGVQRYGRGDFSRPIAVARRDELGELAQQVDTMAADLQRMLDAKRGLLLAISHELRSPLTRARVNAELIDDSDAQRALLRDLGEMRDLISDLLESERLAAGHAVLQTEPTDLNELLQDVIASHFAQREISLAPASESVTLPLDRVRMRLLLRNLIDNALRHSRAAAAPPLVAITAGGGGPRLSVRDFGPGVPEEHLPHLAEPFYRADSARQRATGGVGLGLHLCRLVAEAHGGTLAIRNAAPGLEVVVQLPR